jgi:hypothetical protein
MIKPASLRAAIAAAIPDLGANPDKFLVFADAGTTVANGARSLSFEYRYTLNLILLDFAGDADVVMMALLSWVRRYQSELVNNPEKRVSAITFEVDHLNNATCDLSIKLPLTEAIKVTQGEDGTLLATHLEEPVPEWEIKGLAG